MNPTAARALRYYNYHAIYFIFYNNPESIGNIPTLSKLKKKTSGKENINSFRNCEVTSSFASQFLAASNK